MRSLLYHFPGHLSSEALVNYPRLLSCLPAYDVAVTRLSAEGLFSCALSLHSTDSLGLGALCGCTRVI